MPPAMKRPAGAKFVDPVQARSKLVAEAIQEAEELPERVQEMLVGTVSVTIGQEKATRHPFNERLVEMIEAALDTRQKTLQKNVVDKQSAFDQLAPTKGTRETALETARATEVEKKEAFDNSKKAVAENLAKTHEAAAEVASKEKDQAAGDEELNAIALKKESLEQVKNDSLMPLLDGTVASEERKEQISAVVKVGKTFSFDSSLLEAVVQVLEKSKDERTGFDATCTEQILGAFSSKLQDLDDQVAAGTPAKAERQAAFEQATTAKKLADATQEQLVEMLAAAKEARETATEETKAAKQGLQDFMPELKAAGDVLDEAKGELEDFTSGALTAFNELKEWKEGDFAPPPVATGTGYYETIDGMACDRAIIDACRTAVSGAGDGRVSVDDAKQVFDKVADGGKETQKERWTLRYCMQEFQWTDAAHDWIVEELKKVPQEGAPAKKARTSGASYYETIDGFKCDRGIIDACRELVAGQGDGRVSREDAEKVWAKASDGNEVTAAEKWTLRYCFSTFNWTRAGHDFVIEQLKQAA